MTGIFHEINERRSVMSKSHKRIAEYILSHVKDSSFFTVQVLANSCGTSTTTVIRFAREMGFSGFSDFLKRIRQDALSQPAISDRFNQTLTTTSHDQLLHQTISGDISNINLTMLELSQDSFGEAVELIVKAPRVFVIGLRESFSMAHYMLSRLEAIRRNVFQIQSPGGSYIDQVVSLGEGDVCIYYAFHGYTHKSIQLLGVLRSRKVKVILFTNPPIDAVRDLADIVLTCHVRGVSYKNSYAAPLSLTNYLANAIAVADYSSTMHNLKEFEQTISDNNILY